jgi:putative ABC transport system permease protein
LARRGWTSSSSRVRGLPQVADVQGFIVGLALAAFATAALSSWSLTFSVPVLILVVLAVVAFFAGIAAGILPARRAAHLDPLNPLQYE